MDIQVGDMLKMKKEHPCGSKDACTACRCGLQAEMHRLWT